MKKLMLLLLVCCLALPALAEATPTATPTPAATPTPLEKSAGDLWDSLGNTWNSFMTFTDEAGKAASNWLDGASKEFDKYLAEKAPEVKKWLDDTGDYFNKNVSPEINKAWGKIVESAAEAGTYTQTELQKAYDEIMASLDSSNASPEVREAVDKMAEAAGIKTE